MGVTDQIEERDAQERPPNSSNSTERTTESDADTLPVAGDLDPFNQGYDLSEYDVDSSALDEMLSIAIAVGNLI